MDDGHLNTEDDGTKMSCKSIYWTTPEKPQLQTSVNENASQSAVPLSLGGTQCIFCNAKKIILKEDILHFTCGHVSHTLCFFQHADEYEMFCPLPDCRNLLDLEACCKKYGPSSYKSPEVVGSSLPQVPTKQLLEIGIQSSGNATKVQDLDGTDPMAPDFNQITQIKIQADISQTNPANIYPTADNVFQSPAIATNNNDANKFALESSETLAQIYTPSISLHPAKRSSVEASMPTEPITSPESYDDNGKVLPVGWESKVDNKGWVYYEASSTGKKFWNTPITFTTPSPSDLPQYYYSSCSMCPNIVWFLEVNIFEKNLQWHMEQQHPKCHICPRSFHFNSSMHLEYHVRGEHRCRYCRKDFKDWIERDKHILRRHW